MKEAKSIKLGNRISILYYAAAARAGKLELI